MSRSFLFFLTLAIIAVVAGCPDESLLKPCYCKDNVVQCYHFHNIEDLGSVFTNTLDYVFPQLIVSNSSLTYLRFSWLLDKKINTFSVSNSSLISLFDRVPDTTYPGLVDISLHYSVLLKKLQWSSFRPFIGLQYLKVEGVEVKKLEKSFREGVSSELRVLNMDRTKTSFLMDDVFRGKKNLFYISIRHARIKVLKNSYFKDQKSVLSYMNFSYNPIESLPGDLFNGMTALEHVFLVGAKIKTLSKDLMIKGFFYVSKNPLVCDCKMSWLPGSSSSPEWKIYGECNYPPFLKSKQLKDLKKEHFKDCQYSDIQESLQLLRT